jgi:hypothetical protein
MAENELIDKIWLVWWTYEANYSEPTVTLAKTPEEAFKNEFPRYAKTSDLNFHKYVIEIKSPKCIHIYDGNVKSH